MGFGDFGFYTAMGMLAAVIIIVALLLRSNTKQVESTVVEHE